MPEPQTLSHIKDLVAALDDKKAQDIKVIDVSKISSVTDYFVIATGNSQPHLKALQATIERYLKDNKIHIVGSESGQDSGWVAIDAFSFILHLFLPDMRDIYRLDLIWKDGTPIEIKTHKALS